MSQTLAPPSISYVEAVERRNEALDSLKAAVARLPRTPTLNKDYSILLIEDDEELRELLGASLKNNGLTYVHTQGVGTLKEAKDLLSKRHFDLVCIDLGLPDGNGMDIIAYLPNTTGLIILSGAYEPSILANTAKHASTTWLRKPISGEAWTAVVTEKLR